jgi:uroporphyrinogen decarboxylase
MTPWEQFVAVAKSRHTAWRDVPPGPTPVALIVDSPWLPGYGAMSTLDYFTRPDEWLRVNLQIRDRFPQVCWIPGFWIEYGMLAEPSAFGARMRWHRDSPPSIDPLRGGLDALVEMAPPDPQEYGLLPLILARYADAERRLLPEGIDVKMVTARGPLAVASWLLGVTELLIDLKIEREKAHRMMETLTTTIIAWLRAQVDVLRAPEGILLLDDIVGMLSPKLFDEFVQPYYTRILDAFPGMVKVFHNDTPCVNLLERIETLGFDVFNFSHDTDIARVRSKMPTTVLMGNIPPLGLMVRGQPHEVEAWARDCIAKTGGRGLVLSAGGGVNGGTPDEAIDALVRAAQAHVK